MNEVPKYWEEFKKVVEDHNKRCDEISKVKHDEMLAHYNSLPWYKRMFATHPDTMSGEFEILGYLFKNWPKWDTLSIEEYYNWVLETK